MAAAAISGQHEVAEELDLIGGGGLLADLNNPSPAALVLGPRPLAPDQQQYQQHPQAMVLDRQQQHQVVRHQQQQMVHHGERNSLSRQQQHYLVQAGGLPRRNLQIQRHVLAEQQQPLRQQVEEQPDIQPRQRRETHHQDREGVRELGDSSRNREEGVGIMGARFAAVIEGGNEDVARRENWRRDLRDRKSVV